ncbi:MAG: hypothetical protein LBV66_02550 [Elusimicrobiota bacterium]|jgi:hypothetical protein|nr:hypothetical protein [Elusimicrobiota bacterium]
MTTTATAKTRQQRPPHRRLAPPSVEGNYSNDKKTVKIENANFANQLFFAIIPKVSKILFKDCNFDDSNFKTNSSYGFNKAKCFK